MTPGDIVVIAVILVLIGISVRYLRKLKKSGGCSGNCGGCSMGCSGSECSTNHTEQD